MTTKEAAAIIGCHPRYVRALVSSHKLRADRIVADNGYGYQLSLNLRDVLAFARTRPTQGWPRGKPRNS